MVTASRLRIVFFGTPEFAVPSLDAVIQSRHELVAVVSQPDRPKGRGQQVQVTPTRAVAVSHGVQVLQPAKIRDEAFLQQIRDLGPDLGIVVAFGRLLPDALLAIPRLGMINVHASILPRYRGAAPIQRAVLAGDAETGVTIMRVVTEMDAGPTFAVATVPIPEDATSADMAATLSRLGARLLLPVVEDLAAGRAVETPQDEGLATHAAKISKAESVIDWGEPAAVVHNKVRGLQPWPLASTRLAGERLVLRRTAVLGVRSAIVRRPARTDTDLTPPEVPSEVIDGGPGVSSAIDRRRARTNADLTPGTPGIPATDAIDGWRARTNADLTPGTPGTPGIPATDARPGRILRADGDDLIVACGHGTALRVLEIQPEGRRAMTAREFLAGRGVTEGARFEP